MTRARQTFLFLAGCALVACGGDDDDGIIIADSGPDVDADVTPACGDYGESNEATNDTLTSQTGMAEATGLSFAAGDSVVLCGVLDPNEANSMAETIDIDAFDVDVGEGAPLRAVLRTEGADDTGGIVLLLQYVTEEGVANFGGGGYAEGYAMVTSHAAQPGTWRLAVAGLQGEELPAAPIEYEIEISDALPCAAAAADPDFTEAGDGARSRRNDVVSATWANDPVTVLTDATTDRPEATELTLAAGTAVHLRGTSDDIAPRDDYHDRDSFAVAIGADVNEIDIRLVWPDGDGEVDMDLMAFAADTEMPADLAGGAGAFIGATDDEVVTTRVAAGGGIWLWAGAYTGSLPGLPLDYDITICPRSFTP